MTLGLTTQELSLHFMNNPFFKMSQHKDFTPKNICHVDDHIILESGPKCKAKMGGILSI
jgi:hypothetical protein